MMLYRVYITDCLYAIANKYCEKPVISERYIDIVSNYDTNDAAEKQENNTTYKGSAVDTAQKLFKRMRKKGGC